MKLALLPALCWSARLASASTARIHIHDPQTRDVPARNVGPVAARLVMAQRIGVDDFHSADLERDDVVEAINDYGLQTPMFAAKTAAACEKKAFLLYEGDEDVDAALSSHTSFDISPAPASSAVRGLMLDLARQSDPQNLLHQSDETILSHFQRSHDFTSSTLFYITSSVSDLTTRHGRLANQDYCITTLSSPKDTSSTATSKFHWGAYSLPKSKRAAPTPEKPISDFHSSLDSSSSPLHSFASNSSNSSSTPLRGILPACFTSLSACESSTRNCTGHGTCSKAYRDPDSGSNGLDCYSCKCTATKSEDGKKTTVWAGPACQKKDVSVEFWLLALFTIAMMGLVGFAIGSVWEMGSEELPSVIGAGVSGPTARK